MNLQIHQGKLLDQQGRTLILRGANLGGDSKIPFGPPGWGLRPESLNNPAEASFVGRPFPLEEADERFAQLSRWGLNFIRLIVTWEAIEHQGPGQYDEAYLAYLRKILVAAEKQGIGVFIDPHQDVWSRFTGGDGAPAWTLEALGMDPQLLDATGAALTWQHYGENHGGRPFPPMLWPSNCNRYAAATLFTLFFAGNTYAPGLRIEGESAQDYLQGHYIAAMRHCYRRLKNCEAITGWGTMNEPCPGFIGHRNLASPEKPMIPMGPAPSPFQAMLAASGRRVEAPVRGFTPLGIRTVGREILNDKALSLFREGFTCPWKQAGVWDEQGGKPRLLRKDHFAQYQGHSPNFEDDFLKPFMVSFIDNMQDARPSSLFFVEGSPNGGHPRWEKTDPPNAVNAFHLYDGFSLFFKTFRPWLGFHSSSFRLLLGRKAVAAFYREALEKALAFTREKMGNMPCLLGEFGIPFDMNNRKAYKTGDYTMQEEALALYYDTIDAAQLHATVWTYCASHSEELGDGWNGEDLSIVTQGQGGKAQARALAGWLRPYPMATAGQILEYRWDRKKGIFRYRYDADGSIKAPTEIFLPAEVLGEKPDISVAQAGGWVGPIGLRLEHAPTGQRLLIHHEDYSGEVTLEVRRRV